MAKVQEQAAWIVSRPVEQVCPDLQQFFLRSGMILIQERTPRREWLLSQGSSLKTRLIGGFLAEPEDLPKQAHVRIEAMGEATKVEVAMKETLGFGIFGTYLKRKYAEYFVLWMRQLRAALEETDSPAEPATLPNPNQVTTIGSMETASTADLQIGNFKESLAPSIPAPLAITPAVFPAPVCQISNTVPIKNGLGKRLLYYFLVNAGIVATLSMVLPAAAFFAPVYGFIASFFWLALAKWILKRVHGIRVIAPQTSDPKEKQLYELVESLARRAGLPRVPEVGVYRGDDMNAFATGLSRKRSLVAFSTALLNRMGPQEVAAVAAHEIGHVANGDMVTLGLVQAVVNSLVVLVTIPLQIVKLAALFSDKVGVVTYWMIAIVKWAVTVLLTFLGSLIVMFFSRHREFAADANAAQLTSPEAMIGALTILHGDTSIPPREQLPYAAFKISSSRRWIDLFSTHPSIERRIQALQSLKQPNNLEGL